MAFMRMYGMGAGDPGRLSPRRKSAAAGPRVKAGRKRAVRAKRAARGGGLDFGALGRAALGSVPIVGGVASELAGQVMHKGGGGAASAGMGKGRRTINPANVKALRRSLRRVERFGHLVSRVNKLLPRAHKYQVHPVLKHKRKRRVA
ncbi:MAG TPA: hypothetical protein VNM39_15905 [Verrucomicrobiae bacterium]|nr:hypothetical protein [Verrucomicrobiae bacterium]